MIPKEIIEKAIEGGWLKGFDPRISYHEGGEITLRYGDCFEIFSHHKAVLDPAFWVALGKSLGLTTETTYCPLCGIDRDWQGLKTIEQWRHMAIRFQNLILTNGDLEAFWSEILRGNK